MTSGMETFSILKLTVPFILNSTNSLKILPYGEMKSTICMESDLKSQW